MRELPVVQSFREVYAGVFSHFLELLRLAWLPLLAWLTISVVGNWWVLHHLPAYTPDEMKVLSQGGEGARAVEMAYNGKVMKIMPWIYGMMFLEYCLLSIAAVGFHRFVLLGERFHGWAGTGFAFGRNELLYIWSLIKIGLILFILLIIVSVVVGVLGAVGFGGTLRQEAGAAPGLAVITLLVAGGAAVFAATLSVAPRMSLVLPHVALGNRSEIRAIWRLTKGNGWRLAGYFVLVLLTAAVGSLAVLAPVYMLLGIPLFPSLEDAQSLMSNPWQAAIRFLVGVPVWLVWTMLSITMLSVAYREIVGLPTQMYPDEAGQAPEPA